MEKSDLDGDGKFTFEEFLSAMKENEEANKLIMQIADAQFGNKGYRVSSPGIQNQKYFCLKINCSHTFVIEIF